MPQRDVRLWRKLSRRLFRPIQNDKGQTVALESPDGQFRVENTELTTPTTAPAVSKTGSYTDLVNVPNFAVVAMTGSYTDLTNKPVFAAVATTGQYADLLGKPVLFSGDYNALTNKPALFDGRYASLAGAPVLATVSTSGSYADLANKPVLFDGRYVSLTGAPVLASVATSGNYSDLTNKPVIPGAGQRIRAQTNTSGVYVWTFPIAYATGIRPVIEIAIEESTAGAIFSSKITALTNTSVTIQVLRTNAVTVAGISVLGAAVGAQAFVHLTAVAP